VTEPCAPIGWPEDRVQISVASLSARDLLCHANFLNHRTLALPLADTVAAAGRFGPVYRIDERYIELEVGHAIETIHKVIRNTDPHRYAYEVGERIAWIDPYRLKRLLSAVFGFETCELSLHCSNGFHEAWRAHEVSVRNRQGEPLGMPFSHFSLFAQRE
jgi:hypothetical protein